MSKKHGEYYLNNTATGEQGLNPITEKSGGVAEASSLPKFNAKQEDYRQSTPITKVDEDFVAGLPQYMKSDAEAVATQGQGWWSKFGRSLTGGAAKGVVSALDPVTSLLGEGLMVLDEDIGNFFKEITPGTNAWIDENFPVHETPTDEDAGFGEQFFRFSTLGSIVKSVAEFGLMGAGVGSLTKAVGTKAMTYGASMKGIGSSVLGSKAAATAVGGKLFKLGNTIVNPKSFGAFGKRINTTSLLNGAITNRLEGRVMAEETMREMESFYSPILHNSEIPTEEKDLIREKIAAAGREIQLLNTGLILSDAVGFSVIWPYGARGAKSGVWKYIKDNVKVLSGIEGLEEVVQSVMQSDAKFSAEEGIEKESRQLFGQAIPGLEYTGDKGLGDGTILWEIDPKRAEEHFFNSAKSTTDRLIGYATSTQAMVEGASGALSGGPQWIITGAPTARAGIRDTKRKMEAANKLKADMAENYSNFVGAQILSKVDLNQTIDHLKDQYEGTNQEHLSTAVENYALRKAAASAIANHSEGSMHELFKETEKDLQAQVEAGTITETEAAKSRDRMKFVSDSMNEYKNLTTYLGSEQILTNTIRRDALVEAKQAWEKDKAAVASKNVSDPTLEKYDAEIAKVDTLINEANTEIKNLKSAEYQMEAYANQEKETYYYKTGNTLNKTTSTRKLENIKRSLTSKLESAKTPYEKGKLRELLKVANFKLQNTKKKVKQTTNSKATTSAQRTEAKDKAKEKPTTTTTKAKEKERGVKNVVKRKVVAANPQKKPNIVADAQKRSADGAPIFGINETFTIKKKKPNPGNVADANIAEEKSKTEDTKKKFPAVNKDLENLSGKGDTISGGLGNIEGQEMDPEQRMEATQRVIDFLKGLKGVSNNKFPTFAQAKSHLEQVETLSQGALEGLEYVYGKIHTTVQEGPTNARPDKKSYDDTVEEQKELARENKAFTDASYTISPSAIAWDDVKTLSDYDRVKEGTKLVFKSLTKDEIDDAEYEAGRGFFPILETGPKGEIEPVYYQREEYEALLLSRDPKVWDTQTNNIKLAYQPNAMMPIRVSIVEDGSLVDVGWVHNGAWIFDIAAKKGTTYAQATDALTKLMGLRNPLIADLKTSEGAGVKGKIAGRKSNIQLNDAGDSIKGAASRKIGRDQELNPAGFFAKDPNVEVAIITKSSKNSLMFSKKFSDTISSKGKIQVIPKYITDQAADDLNGNPVVFVPVENTDFLEASQLFTNQHSVADFEMITEIMTTMDRDLTVNKLRSALISEDAFPYMKPSEVKGMLASTIFLSGKDRNDTDHYKFNVVAKDHLTDPKEFVSPEAVEGEFNEEIKTGTLEVQVSLGSKKWAITYQHNTTRLTEGESATSYTVIAGRPEDLKAELDKANKTVGRPKITQYNLRSYALDLALEDGKAGFLESVDNAGTQTWRYSKQNAKSVVLNHTTTTYAEPVELPNKKFNYHTNTIITVDNTTSSEDVKNAAYTNMEKVINSMPTDSRAYGLPPIGQLDMFEDMEPSKKPEDKTQPVIIKKTAAELETEMNAEINAIGKPDITVVLPDAVDLANSENFRENKATYDGIVNKQERLEKLLGCL